MAGGRAGALRVNLPDQQRMMSSDEIVDAHRMHLLMLAAEKSKQTSSSYNHCPCSKCQVKKGFLFCLKIRALRIQIYIFLYYNYLSKNRNVLLLLFADYLQFNYDINVQILAQIRG
jgi:uncharacterized membrane protein YukC